MKCVFKKIVIHNFKSFADQTFDFSAKPGITTIIGVNNDIPGAANAAGKSSLFSALFYVLFGKDGIKTKNKFLKNRYIDSNEFYVQLYLSIDGKNFKIDRGSVGVNSYLRLYSIDNGIEQEISKASIVETEFFLKHMLSNLTSDIFLKTVLLSPALGQNFFMLPAKERAEFLNLLAGTNRIYSINELVSKDINGLNTNIKILDNTLMSLSKQIDMLKKKKEDFLANQETVKKEHNAQIERHNKTIEQNVNDLQTHTANYEKLKEIVDKIHAEYDELQKTLQTVKLKIVASATKVKSLASKNTQLNSFIDKNIGLIEKLCNDCKHKIDKYLDIENTKHSIEENERIILEEKKALLKMQSEFDEVNKKIANNKSNDEKYTPSLNAEYAAIIKLNKSIESEKELIKTIENNAKATDTAEPFSEMIENAENDLTQKKNEKDDNSKERQKLAIIKFMTSDDIIHRFVISQFAKDINMYTMQYLNMMGCNYMIQFGNDLSYEFTTPAGEVSYDTFSSGEKMRINIALSFAFRKLLFKYLNIDMNILILDEYLDSALDKLAINGLLNLLNELCNENANISIYVVSHRKEIVSEINGNKIIIQKTNGISEIIEENR